MLPDARRHEPFATQEDAATWSEFGRVDGAAAVAGPRVVTFSAVAGQASVVASGLVDAMPVRAVQGRHDRPACRSFDEIADVGVGEVIAWRSLHGPVLPLGCDIASHDEVEVPFRVEAVVPFGDGGLAASAFDPVAANVHRLDEGQRLALRAGHRQSDPRA